MRRRPKPSNVAKFQALWNSKQSGKQGVNTKQTIKGTGIYCIIQIIVWNKVRIRQLTKQCLRTSIMWWSFLWLDTPWSRRWEEVWMAHDPNGKQTAAPWATLAQRRMVPWEPTATPIAPQSVWHTNRLRWVCKCVKNTDDSRSKAMFATLTKLDMYMYAQTPRFAHTLLVFGRSTKVLGNIKVPPWLNFKFILHSFKIFNKGLISHPR